MSFAGGKGFIRELVGGEGGEGFVASDAEGALDVFVHFKAIVAEEGVYKALKPGQHVSYIIETQGSRLCAADVRAPDGGPAVLAEVEQGASPRSAGGGWPLFVFGCPSWPRLEPSRCPFC